MNLSFSANPRSLVRVHQSPNQTLDIEPIERMEEATQLPDRCRETEVTVTDNEPLSEQIAQLINLMQLCKAPGARKVQNYSWRSWVGWLDERQKHHELKNVDPYHPGKYAMGLYLLQMRVLYQYSHSTVVNCFWNQLCCTKGRKRH